MPRARNVRGVRFERGDLLDDLEDPNRDRQAGRRIFVVPRPGELPGC
jgi:hypothetical protein